MVSIRIVGGPFPKQDRCVVDVDPQSTPFSHVYRLAQDKWLRHPNNTSKDDSACVIAPSAFQLVELEESGEGSSGRPALRVLGPVPLDQTLHSHPLVVPVLMLRPLQQAKRSVSFSERRRVRVIGGPILSSDRVFVEDAAPGDQRVLFVADLFDQIAQHLPNSVHPAINAANYELLETVAPRGSSRELETGNVLQPLEPVRLDQLSNPILILKSKTQEALTISPSLVNGSSAGGTAVENNSFVFTPSMLSVPSSSGELTSSISMRSPEPATLAAHQRGGTDASPTRRQSSFFRTVANAMLGTRRASSLLGDEPEEELKEPPVPAAQATTPAAIPPANGPPVKSFLADVTFALTVSLWRRDAAAALACENWGTASNSNVVLERAVPIVVTPHMTLRAITAVLQTQVGGALSLADAKWFLSDSALTDALISGDPSALANVVDLEATPYSLQLTKPTLAVFLAKQMDEDSLSADVQPQSRAFDAVQVPRRRHSWVKLAPNTNTADVRSILDIAEESFDPQLAFEDLVMLQRRLMGVHNREKGPMLVSALLRTWQQALNPSLVEPDAVGAVHASVVQRARTVLSALGITVGRDGELTFPRNASESTVRAITVAKVSSVIESRQIIRSRLVALAYAEEPQERRIAREQHVMETQEICALCIIDAQHQERCELEVASLRSMEQVHRVLLAARAYSALMSRAFSVFALLQHLREERDRDSLNVEELSARERAEAAAIIREERDIAAQSLQDATVVLRRLQGDHFIQSTQRHHFEEESSVRHAIHNDWFFQRTAHDIYFDQFCRRKRILACNDVWFASVTLELERLVAGEDVVRRLLRPFYVLAWGQRSDLLLAHETSVRCCIRAKSEEIYNSLCASFAEWIDERNVLRDQLDRMELSKLERIARVRVQEQQQHDVEALHFVIEDSLGYHWQRHEERVAICSREAQKRARWESINANLRDIWSRFHHVLTQAASQYRRILKDEAERSAYFAFLKEEIRPRVSILEEEWHERVTVQKLYAQIAFQRHIAMVHIMTSSNRVILEDEEERTRADIRDCAYEPYVCWAQLLVAARGESAYRAFVSSEEASLRARLRLVGNEITHRRALEVAWSQQRASWREALGAIALESSILGKQRQPKRQACSLIVRVAPQYVPRGSVTVSIERGCTTAANVLAHVRSHVVTDRQAAFDKNQFSIVANNGADVVMPTALLSDIVPVESTSVTVDLRSRAELDEITARLAHISSSTDLPPLYPMEAPPATVLPRLLPAHPTLDFPSTGSERPSKNVRRKSKPKTALLEPRARSPPRKAALPEEARRKSCPPSHDSPMYSAAIDTSPVFKFRVHCGAGPAQHLTLTATCQFAQVLPSIQQVWPDVLLWGNVLVFPAVLLNGRVSPSGKPVQEHDTVQSRGLFGGSLLVVRRNRVATTTSDTRRRDATEGEEYEQLLPDQQRWHTEDDVFECAAGTNEEEVAVESDRPLSLHSLVENASEDGSHSSHSSASRGHEDFVAAAEYPSAAAEDVLSGLNEAPGSGLPSARASPRNDSVGQTTGSSLASLPGASLSSMPFRFDRPITPVFDGVDSPFGIPTLQSFGITDDAVVRHAEETSSCAATEVVVDSPEGFVNSQAAAPACTEEELRAEVPSADEDATAPVRVTDGECCKSGDGSMHALQEAPETTPLMASVTADSACLTVLEPQPTLTPHQSSLVDFSTLSIIGGPISPSAPLTVSVDRTTSLDQVLQLVAEKLSWTPDAVEEWMLCEVVVKAQGTTALRQRRGTTCVRECAGMTFALRSKPKHQPSHATLANKPVENIAPEKSMDEPPPCSDEPVEKRSEVAELSPPRCVEVVDGAADSQHAAPSNDIPHASRSPYPSVNHVQRPLQVPVRVIANGHHCLVEQQLSSSTIQDVLQLAEPLLHVESITNSITWPIVKDGHIQMSTGDSHIVRRLDRLDVLMPLISTDAASERVLLLEKRMPNCGDATDDLFDLSELPHCVVLFKHSDDRAVGSGQLLRPSIDTAFRSILKLGLEGRGAALDMQTAQVFVRCHGSLRDLFSTISGNVVMESLVHRGSTSHDVVKVEDLNETPISLLQLPSAVPSFLSLFVIVEAPPRVLSPPQAAPPLPAPLPVKKPAGLFARLRSAILGSPPEDELPPPPASVVQTNDDAFGFDYEEKYAPSTGVSEGASVLVSDPICIRVLGGPVPPLVKLVVTLMSTETVASILSHCRNRLMELGHSEDALRCSDEHFQVHYVRRQLGQQRATAGKDPLRPGDTLADCGMGKGSHVVTLRSRPPKMGDVVFDAMQENNVTLTRREPQRTVVQKIRVVGGPIPKQARVYISMPPGDMLYRDWFPCIEASFNSAAVSSLGHVSLSPDAYSLAEMEIPEGGGPARQRRLLPLEQSFDSSPMFSLVIALRKLKPVEVPIAVSSVPLGHAISIGDALDIKDTLPELASPSKSVKWGDQAITRVADHRTLRVRVIGAPIPPQVKMFVTLGAWMSFGAVFRLVSEQLSSLGLPSPGDRFSEDHWVITAMKLDATSQLLVADRPLLSIDEVHTAMDVKVLMVSLPNVEAAGAGQPALSSPPRSGTVDSAVTSVPPSRTSRVVPIRVVGVPGIPSSSRLVIHASLSTKIRVLFDMVTEAARTLAQKDPAAAAAAQFECLPQSYQLVEIEVGDNGSHRRKQLLEIESTLFLSDFGAPMSLIRVEALKAQSAASIAYTVLGSPQDSSLDLSGNVDVFTPKRRQHRRLSHPDQLPPYELPHALQVGPQHANLGLDTVGLAAMDSYGTGDLLPEQSDPFSIDIDTQAYDAPTSRPVGSGVWEATTPEQTPRVVPNHLSAAVTTEVQPLPLDSLSPEPARHGVAPPDQTVMAMPVSVPHGDDCEFEGMHVEVVSDNEDDVYQVRAYSHVQLLEAYRHERESPPPVLPASSAPGSAVSSHTPVVPQGNQRFHDDVDISTVSAQNDVEVDRHDEGSPKHFYAHARVAGSPYGSFRKRLAGGIDTSLDTSPRRSGSRENKDVGSAVRVTPLATLEPCDDTLRPKPRPTDVLLAEDDEDAIRMFQTMVLRDGHKGHHRGPPRTELEKELRNVEQSLHSEALPQLRGSWHKAPTVSHAHNRKQSRGRSVEPTSTTGSSAHLPPISRSMEFPQRTD